MYQDEYHPQVKKDIKPLSPTLRELIQTQHLPKLLANPYQGELLVGDLNGIRSYHFTSAKQPYRIAYVVEENTHTVFILMIGKRGEFYSLLKKRVKS
jgi:addiction module RelE/StbE family toxin